MYTDPDSAKVSEMLPWRELVEEDVVLRADPREPPDLLHLVVVTEHWRHTDTGCFGHNACFCEHFQCYAMPCIVLKTDILPSFTTHKVHRDTVYWE